MVFQKEKVALKSITFICRFWLLVFIPLQQGFAQSLPESEIYLIKVIYQAAGIRLEDPQNISRHRGYDNQPWFDKQSKTLFFVQGDSTGNTEIARYNPGMNTILLTHTPDREFSPRIAPDPLKISAVLQRKDGKQDLVLYQLDGRIDKLLYSGNPVGYYCWINSKELLAFIVSTPNYLEMRNLVTGETTLIADSIGRTILPIPRSESYSYTRIGKNGSQLFAYYPRTGKSEPLLRLPDKREDYTWTKNGFVLLTEPTRILFAKPGANVWREVTLPAELAGKTFSRIVLSDNGKLLALVVH